ncbi:unconventional myosin-XVIIIa isoform X1 [Ixodes scapularis]|uniref:unconventional myosin-XVIIIa isoform X1 n=1 Tax=Ixodes scapularis TaxID=6945 RepID=UPI001C3914B9|nr:unconventional myosin-XVIIIa isoform X1 [Ixodes scapularis]XP_042146627.1 unconventional myosin-XVIIIa isoform X1 [Ixodes scapularis]XP_042146628.1 unconventional myosin-XVIIIa isoform X1 [Ixodes scapularis]
MFPWKKAKDKDDKSKRRDDKKGSSSGDGRRRHLVISGPIPTRAGGALVSPLPEEDDCPATDAGPAPTDAKKPPPVPPKKPAVARTLSVPKARPPDRPAPRSSSLVAQPLASVFKQAVRNGHAVVDAQAPAARATPVSAGLCLPPIRAALRCPQPRVLTVVRQPSGDFGFSLRRSALSDGLAGDDRRRTLMFAEPSTLGSGGGGTGLLPGDRLLEVNGASVDERTREEVVEMVRSSGDRVSLKVQPLPELCEIVARVAGGGPPGATQGRHRTLSRTGSRRHRTLGAKTDEEIAEERQWLQSEKVWVLFDGGYAGASLVKGDQVTPREGRVRVRLDATGELLDVDQEDVDKANPPQLDFVEDLAQLRQLNEAGLLHALRGRFASGLVHCYAGPALLCFNPQRPLAIYSEKVMRLLRDCPADDLPPHVFAVAQAAHAALVSTRRDQTVLFLGRSGAGKTGAAKQVLQYLAITCAPSTQVGAPLAEKLTAASALLESFGNSRTWANANASRFSQLFSLEFDIAGQLVSASVQALMLERWRVSGLRKGEPNFHIFHYLLAGVGDSLRKELFLESLDEQNLFVMPQRKPEERSKCALMWELVQGSLLTLGVRESEAKGLWSVLGAICHLGEAGTLRGTSGRLQFQRGDSAQRAALLLGTSVEDLHRAVFAHEALLSAGGNSRLASRTGDGDPQEPLQDFVAALYMEVFGAVVSLVNRALGSAGRSVATVQVLDCPGFQSGKLATLEDLCHNYVQERLQLLFHQHTFLAQQERYQQEKVAVEEAEEVASPQGLVSLLDRIPPQGAALRASSCDLQQTDQSCGLLQLLDDEALYPGNTDDAFLDRLLRMGPANDGREQRLVHPGPREGQFVLHHQLGSLPVTYGVQGWLRAAREGPAFRQAQPLLQESHKEQLAQLFGCSRGPLASAGSTLSLDAGASSSLRRTPSIRRAQSVAAAKRRSLPLQVKYTTDGMLEVLRRTRLHFVHCLVPSMQPLEQGTGGAADDAHFDVPLVRSQLKGAQVLDAVRLRKQGFPENLQYTEFRRRYSLLASADCTPERGDERTAVEALLHHLDMEPSSYRLGLSQIFLRAGTLSQLEAQRDERLSEEVVRLQARARGFLARRRHQQRKVQAMALCCIQRNVRRFLEIRSWPWWRLFVKIAPVLNVHRTEEQLKSTLEEVGQLRAKLEKAEKERSELRQNHDLLEAKVGDLWVDLGQEQAASAQAAEMLEAETAERLRLDKEVRELQARCCQLQQQKDRLEMEAMESRMLRSADLNGHLSDEDDGVGGSSVYKQKYERAVREAEMTRRKASQQHEEELEKQLLARKATEKRLTEALDSLEEGRQAVGQWKRKAQKLAAELQDLKLLVEEHMARNAELERKQRRFDGELSTASEGMRQERAQREKVQREKEALYAEKLSLEQELSAVRSELDSQHDKLGSLRREMDELSFSSHGEEEVAKLKRGKQELERKSREQEEELEDLAGQVQLLEQAKLRLEMALEKQRQEYKREISLREEEMDEARAAASKKLRNLESLLESEQEERQALSRQRQELERRLGELSALPPPRDPQVERRLRRDLRRTRALLQDAQQRLEGARDGQAARALLRQLKNQLEDAEFAKTAAMKARQGAEMELQEVQCQLEEVLRTKNESEGRCIQLTREKSALQMQLEEMEEEQAELLKKYRSAVQQMASDQKAMAEQNQQILDLESEKHHLREQVHDLSSKMDHLSSQAEDSHAVRRLEAKVRDLESRLELEQTSKARLESQVARLKEQSGRLQEECEQAAQREHASQEGCRKLQRQLRELREDCASLQQREAEAHQRCHELELSLENAETDLQGTKQDLKLACQRIQDLQAALEEDLDSGTDLADDDSESDSDQDMDVDSLLRRHGLGPHKMAAGDCSPVFSRRSSGSVGLSLSRSNESTPSGPVSPDATEQRGNGRTLYKDDQLVDV